MERKLHKSMCEIYVALYLATIETQQECIQILKHPSSIIHCIGIVRTLIAPRSTVEFNSFALGLGNAIDVHTHVTLGFL